MSNKPYTIIAATDANHSASFQRVGDAIDWFTRLVTARKAEFVCIIDDGPILEIGVDDNREHLTIKIKKEVE